MTLSLDIWIDTRQESFGAFSAQTFLEAEVYEEFRGRQNIAWYSFISRSFEIGVKIRFCTKSPRALLPNLITAVLNLVTTSSSLMCDGTRLFYFFPSSSQDEGWTKGKDNRLSNPSYRMSLTYLHARAIHDEF